MPDNLLDTNTNNQNVDVNKDYRAELVGEGKKFKDDKELARGKYESDLYIKTLETKQDELRSDYLKLKADYDARAKLEEVIDKLGTLQSTTTNEQPVVKKEVTDKPVDLKQIESLVSSQFQALKASDKQTENYNMVKEKLQQHFGDNYPEVVRKQLENLGITEQELNEDARKRPAFVLRALGIDGQPKQETFQAPPRSSQRSDNFAPKGSQKRSWSYYQTMKKENPKLYYDPKTNVQIHNDMMELGESFMDGDYKRFG